MLSGGVWYGGVRKGMDDLVRWGCVRFGEVSRVGVGSGKDGDVRPAAVLSGKVRPSGKRE